MALSPKVGFVFSGNVVIGNYSISGLVQSKFWQKLETLHRDGSYIVAFGPFGFGISDRMAAIRAEVREAFKKSWQRFAEASALPLRNDLPLTSKGSEVPS